MPGPGNRPASHGESGRSLPGSAWTVEVETMHPRERGDFWAITCYFNPVGYRRRLANYHTFRRHLAVPLVTVELAFDDEPFQLASDDADIMVQLRGGDVLWQKERLLNVALQALPDACRTVAWLDCDILLRREDWHEEANRLLGDFELVQLFGEVHHLPPDAPVDQVAGAPPLRKVESLGRQAVENRLPPAWWTSESENALGRAWACRRETLARHGIYDAMVLGSGDKALVSAAFGRHEQFLRSWQFNVRQAEHYRSWAWPFFDAIRAKVGFVEAVLEHLWHGDLDDRGYLTRYDGFDAFDFDPYADISISREGCWCWSSDKSEMHVYVRRYFHSRREDGSAHHP